MTAVLQTRGLIKRFGGIHATDDVNFTLEQGGASCADRPQRRWQDDAGQSSHRRSRADGRLDHLAGRGCHQVFPLRRGVRRGLARTFQINQLCAGMSVLEMILMVANERQKRGTSLFSRLDANAAAVESVAEILERFRLVDVMDEKIATLPYGKQRQVEIAAAFAVRPKVLLLDEPAAGVPEAERQELLDTVAELPKDVSVVLIEHDMDIVFRFATRITVLVNGKVLTEGDPQSVAADPAVKAAYLGEASHG